jgi:hypothetical protein
MFKKKGYGGRGPSSRIFRETDNVIHLRRQAKPPPKWKWKATLVMDWRITKITTMVGYCVVEDWNEKFGDSGYACPSHQQLAVRCHRTTRSVITALKELEGLGYFRTVRKRGKRNHYVIDIPTTDVHSGNLFS